MKKKLKSSDASAGEQWLTRSEVVEVFAEMGHPITCNTLDRWRLRRQFCRYDKPRLEFHKNKFTGRIRYSRDEVVKFIEKYYR